MERHFAHRKFWFGQWLLSRGMLRLAICFVALLSPAANFAAPLQDQNTGSNRPFSAGAQLPVFEFHSSFWLNLHHFLYLQARLSIAGDAAGAADVATSPNDLPAEDIAAWQSAVAFYAKDLARRDLKLNGDMQIINNRLAEMDSCEDLAGKSSADCRSGLQSGLVDTLDRAAAVYRAHWWPEQDRINREWIARVAYLVSELGVQLVGQLSDVYERPWPSGRLRVDVVDYAGLVGSYSSLNPLHVTISSQDPRNKGIYGFEVLFQESSLALSSSVTTAISREFRRRDKPIPRNLWPALLFYTTGELVRRDLFYASITGPALEGVDPAHYQPYAARFGLYSGPWGRFRGSLDLYWQPYLQGLTTFDAAIARLAAAE